METKIIANRAYKWFLVGDFSVDAKSSSDVVVDVEDAILVEDDEQTLDDN